MPNAGCKTIWLFADAHQVNINERSAAIEFYTFVTLQALSEIPTSIAV